MTKQEMEQIEDFVNRVKEDGSGNYIVHAHNGGALLRDTSHAISKLDKKDLKKSFDMLQMNMEPTRDGWRISGNDRLTASTIWNAFIEAVQEVRAERIMEARLQAALAEAPAEKPEPGKKQDLYEEATAKIIAAIEKAQETGGPLPWRKPWDAADYGPHRNPITGTEYSGINAVLLAIAANEKGFDDPRWLTFNNIKSKGYTLEKGSKAETIYYFEMKTFPDIDKDTGKVKIDPETGEEKVKLIPLCKASKVFNASNINGIEPLPKPEKHNWTPEQMGEAIAMLAPCAIKHGGNRAYYAPGTDHIGMPQRDSFKSPTGYYATLAHEIGHSTGHKDRLARDFSGRFGSEAYAFEELVAELTSVMVQTKTGLPVSDIEQHAGYVQSWVKVLQDDKKAIFTASAQAKNAVAWLEEQKPRFQSPALADHFQAEPGDTLKLTLASEGKTFAVKGTFDGIGFAIDKIDGEGFSHLETLTQGRIETKQGTMELSQAQLYALQTKVDSDLPQIAAAGALTGISGIFEKDGLQQNVEAEKPASQETPAKKAWTKQSPQDGAERSGGAKAESLQPVGPFQEAPKKKAWTMPAPAVSVRQPAPQDIIKIPSDLDPTKLSPGSKIALEVYDPEKSRLREKVKDDFLKNGVIEASGQLTQAGRALQQSLKADRAAQKPADISPASVKVERDNPPAIVRGINPAPTMQSPALSDSPSFGR